MDPVECDPVCLDAVLNGEDMSNKQAIYELVTISLLRLLHSLEEDNDDWIQLLTNVLGEGAPLIGTVRWRCRSVLRWKGRWTRTQQNFQGCLERTRESDGGNREC